jgi:hypothetical protein
MLNAWNTNRKMKTVVFTAMIAPTKSQSKQNRFNLNGNSTGFLIKLTVVNALVTFRKANTRPTTYYDLYSLTHHQTSNVYTKILTNPFLGSSLPQLCLI